MLTPQFPKCYGANPKPLRADHQLVIWPSSGEYPMSEIPKRDITGKCDEGECRDRVFEGEVERQSEIDTTSQKYSSPAEKSPTWTERRNDPPGAMGGRV
jgi:hypothetical protein